MLRELTKSEIKPLLTYLKEDVENCIYMYTDIFMYGLDNPNMKVWIEEQPEGFNLVVMKYHDSFQLYYREGEWDVDGVYDLACEYDITMINGKREMIHALAEKFGDRYEYSEGTIMRLNAIQDFTSPDNPEIATLDDVVEIAELLAQDDYYSDSYTVEELSNQLRERMETGMGRSCIIRRDGKIIAHCASFTEADGIAVSAGTIAHKDYRGQKLGLIVENYMNRLMNNLGFKWFGFILEEGRVKTFEEMGNEIVATYGKLIKHNA